MVATDDMTKEEREEYWALVFEEYQESGLCKTEYCRNNDIPVSTFNYWLKRLTGDHVSDEGRFAELIIPEKRTESLDQISPSSVLFRPEMILEYRGARLQINSSTPQELIKRVLGDLDYVE